MASDGLEFQEKVLLKSGFIPSDGPTDHPDVRMGWKLEDMVRFYDPPLSSAAKAPIELVMKRNHKTQAETEGDLRRG